MDEKKAIKRLRMIETEIAYLEKNIGKQKKMLNSFSKGYFLRLIAVTAGIALVVAAITLYSLSLDGISSFEPTCLVSFFLFIMAFFLIIALLSKDHYEKQMFKGIKGMECWLEHYKKEKERLLSEHPELGQENIRPYRVHYWDIYSAYMAFAIIILLLLGFLSPLGFYRTEPFFYAIIMISLAAAYIQRKHYVGCPKQD